MPRLRTVVKASAGSGGISARRDLGLRYWGPLLADLECERFRGLLRVVQVDVYLVIANRPGVIVAQVELELTAAALGTYLLELGGGFRTLDVDRGPHRLDGRVVGGVGKVGDAVERVVGRESLGRLLVVFIARHLRVFDVGCAGAEAPLPALPSL